MNDVIIFGMGCFVSLVVASAVGLLLWGAANEPRGGVVPAKTDRVVPQTTPTSPTPASARNLESKSLA